MTDCFWRFVEKAKGTPKKRPPSTRTKGVKPAKKKDSVLARNQFCNVQPPRGSVLASRQSLKELVQLEWGFKAGRWPVKTQRRRERLGQKAAGVTGEAQYLPHNRGHLNSEGAERSGLPGNDAQSSSWAPGTVTEPIMVF